MRGSRKEGRKQFFFEKKNQKTFDFDEITRSNLLTDDS